MTPEPLPAEFDQLIRSFQRHLRATNRSPRTVEKYLLATCAEKDYHQLPDHAIIRLFFDAGLRRAELTAVGRRRPG